MAQLKPLGDKIILTNIEKGEKVTKGGIIIADDSTTAAGERGIRPRWAEVYAIGPKQKDVNVGDWVLMDHGRWTEEHQLTDDNGEKISVLMGDPNGILGVSTDGKPENL